MPAGSGAPGGHRAEAWRKGNPPDLTFGWDCLDCPAGETGLFDAAAAENRAAWHSEHGDPAHWCTVADDLAAKLQAADDELARYRPLLTKVAALADIAAALRQARGGGR